MVPRDRARGLARPETGRGALFAGAPDPHARPERGAHQGTSSRRLRSTPRLPPAGLQPMRGAPVLLESPMHRMSRREFVTLGAVAPGVLGTGSLGLDLGRARTVQQQLRLAGAKVSHSLCPYCAVGCSILAYTRTDEHGRPQLLQIEGDPD